MTTTFTDLKRIDHVIDHVIDHSSGRPQSEYWGYYDGQLIGVKSTNSACERMLDEYAYDLLSSDLVIPATTLDGQCGGCGQTLDSLGLCGCGAEEPARAVALCDACAHAAALRGSLGPRISAATEACAHCGETAVSRYELKDRLPAWLNETPRHTLSCTCGQPAPILESHGAFCGACYEASGLWQLWKTDSTAFVAELRRQRCRLNEMAVRLVVWLNAKNGSALGCDSILAMWRQLLDDDEPPKPRFYVVARQQVAA